MAELMLLLAVVFLFVSLTYATFQANLRRQSRSYFAHRKAATASVNYCAKSRKKPDWVIAAVLALHAKTGFSHRKLSALFNQTYFSQTGVSVGRTWVQQLLLRIAYEAMQARKKNKHRIPRPTAILRIWAADTTTVTDANGLQNTVLGIIDRGSRLNLSLRYLRRFNAWTFLGCVFFAIGEYGKPAYIKTDNHAVFHSRLVKRVLHYCGIKQTYSPPNQPWKNGYIERFFGSFKTALAEYVIHDKMHLIRSLPQFQFWYNFARPHQHIQGRTPAQMWAGINPYRCIPKGAAIFNTWSGQLRGIVLRF